MNFQHPVSGSHSREATHDSTPSPADCGTSKYNLDRVLLAGCLSRRVHMGLLGGLQKQARLRDRQVRRHDDDM
jgi:hypothetical protein